MSELLYRTIETNGNSGRIDNENGCQDIVAIIYLFILLYKSYSKYKKKIQQLSLYKNKHTKITNGKM